MSRALSSFLGGMAGGYITESNRQQDQSRLDLQEIRQAKLDQQREQEFALRKQQIEGQLADQDLVRTERAALKDSQADATQSNEWTQSTAGKTPEEIQALAEQMSTGEDMGQAGVSVGAGAKQKSFLKDEAGLAGASAYKDTLNSPDAKAAKWINTLNMQGKGSEAMEFKAKWENHKQDLAKAQLSAVTNAGLGMIQTGNYQGLVKAYNDHFKDGRTAVYNPGRAGGGSIAIFQGDPVDGNLVGTMNFKDSTDAAKQFYASMNAAETIKGKIASEQKMAEDQGKVHVVDKSLVRNDGKLLYKGSTPTPKGMVEVTRPDGSTAFEPAVNKVPEGITAGLDAQKDLVPEAHAFYRSLLKNGLGDDPAQAEAVAVRMARARGTNTQSSFDVDAAKFKTVFQDLDEKGKDGKVMSKGTGRTYTLWADDMGQSARITPEMAAEAVTQIKAKVKPEVFAAYAAAGAGDGRAKFEANIKATQDGIIASAQGRMKNEPDPVKRQAILALAEKQLAGVELEVKRAELVAQFYKPPAQPKPTSAVVTNPAQGASPASPVATPTATPRPGISPVNMGDDFESPSAKAALALRVDQASRGGPPLTRVEKLRAQQTGLMS